MTDMRRPILIHVVLAWAASLMVHGGVAAALLQYYSQPKTKPDIPVMELVQLPVIIAPPAPTPEPPQPVQPPPPRKPPPVARPKRLEPVVAEHIEPAPPVETAAQVEPPPPIVQATANPVPVTSEPEPVVDLKAAYLENPRPAYPEVARRRGWEGTVVIHLMLDEDGLPHGLRIQSSSGFDELDRAALASVQGWRFRPATRNGEAVAMPSVLVPIQFRLKN
jgi:periplasmic protein TonB